MYLSVAQGVARHLERTVYSARMGVRGWWAKVVGRVVYASTLAALVVVAAVGACSTQMEFYHCLPRVVLALRVKGIMEEIFQVYRLVEVEELVEPVRLKELVELDTFRP
jgi:hypothetical protein